MFENIVKFFKKLVKAEQEDLKSKDAAKERLHLVLMQDRANVSADFLELMKQEIIEVIKKYIDVDENAIDVRLTNKTNDDGTTGAPALYANIPIVSLKEEVRRENNTDMVKEQEEVQGQSEQIEDAKKIMEENQEPNQEEEVKEELNVENEIQEENKIEDPVIIQPEENGTPSEEKTSEEGIKTQMNGDVIIDKTDSNKENANVQN